MNQATAEQWFCDPQFYKTVPLYKQQELFYTYTYGQEGMPNLEAKVYILEERLKNLANTVATTVATRLGLVSQLNEIYSLILINFLIMMLAIAFCILNQNIIKQEDRLNQLIWEQRQRRPEVRARPLSHQEAVELIRLLQLHELGREV